MRPSSHVTLQISPWWNFLSCSSLKTSNGPSSTTNSLPPDWSDCWYATVSGFTRVSVSWSICSLTTSLILVLDMTSISINLSSRRDRGLYLFKESYQILMKLARRSVSSKSLPREDQLQLIPSLESKKAIALPVEDFLTRLKFGAKFNHACKVRAER